SENNAVVDNNFELLEDSPDELFGLFSSRGDFENYIQIDNELEAAPVEDLTAENDVNVETDSNSYLVENTISIDEALPDLKKLKGFYYGENIDSIEYSMLIKIEHGLYGRYCKKRAKQMTLSNNFNKDNNLKKI
ncbi:hypothetical protein ENBRE01_3465, partial [Enteropsectra breve]